MNRREFVKTGVFAGIGTLAAPMINRGVFNLFADTVEYSTRAIELVNNSMVIDMLGLLTLDWPKLYGWQREPARFSAADFQQLRGSGVNVFHPAVEPNAPDPYKAALKWTTGWNHFLHGRPEEFLRVDTAGDLKRSREEGKIGLLIGFQNSDHFRTAADVETFHAVGQRVSQLTYNDCNRIGAGCREPDKKKGLTPFGVEIVRAMNQVGMVVDVSHCSERTARDAFAASAKPVLVTHSNCRALVPHPRCKTDTAIKAMAAKGGVMGITVIPAFVKSGQPATVGHVLDHFDHVAKLVGVEHVGLGSDADPNPVDPKTKRIRPRYQVLGLKHPQRVFDLTQGLIKRGYTDRQIEMILGGNFQRALGEIWNVAPKVPATVSEPAARS